MYILLTFFPPGCESTFAQTYIRQSDHLVLDIMLVQGRIYKYFIHLLLQERNCVLIFRNKNIPLIKC